MEFNRNGGFIQCIGMDCILCLVYQLLSTSHIEFQKEKVSVRLKLSLYDLFMLLQCVFQLSTLLCAELISPNWTETCSVIGLNFDFVVLNLTKHSSYLIYNASVFFSSAVQRQYRQKYGLDEVLIYLSLLLYVHFSYIDV